MYLLLMMNEPVRVCMTPKRERNILRPRAKRSLSAPDPALLPGYMFKVKLPHYAVTGNGIHRRGAEGNGRGGGRVVFLHCQCTPAMMDT